MAKKSSKEIIKNEKDIQLIEAVRTHPCLYDMSSGEYRNNKRKSDIWEGIGATCGFESNKLILLFIKIFCILYYFRWSCGSNSVEKYAGSIQAEKTSNRKFRRGRMELFIRTGAQFFAPAY